jgi:ferredoxin
VTFLTDGLSVEAAPGQSLLEAARLAGAPVGNLCGGNCACSSCHLIVVEGGGGLSAMDEPEEDTLDKAFGVEARSRLGCQARLGTSDVVVEVSRESRQAFEDEHR